MSSYISFINDPVTTDSTVVSVIMPSRNAQVTTGESAEDATSMSRQGGLKLAFLR